MKYYEILPTHTETPRNTTRKIANLYIEFNYHFLTLQKINPITFEQECTIHPGKSQSQTICIHSRRACRSTMTMIGDTSALNIYVICGTVHAFLQAYEILQYIWELDILKLTTF